MPFNKNRFFRIILFPLYMVYFILFSSCAQQSLQITLLHHNDFHAANTPFTAKLDTSKYNINGIAGLKGLASAVQDTSAPSMWLFAGDEFTGTPISSMTKGASQIQILQNLGIDVAVIGNHEFDYGTSRAHAYCDSIGVPVLGGANLINPDGTPFTTEFYDTNIGDVPVRIIGLVPPNLYALTGDNATGHLEVLDLAESVRKHLPTPDRLTIALTHVGLPNDVELAEKVPEIDVIIGGHQHAIVEKPIVVSTGGVLEGDDIYGDGKSRIPGVLVTQAGQRGIFLGVLSLAVKKGDIVAVSGQLLMNDGTLAEPDPKIQKIVDSLEDEFTKSLTDTIAILSADLTRKPWGEESVLGRWITDAYRSATNSEIAFQNPGGIRKNLDAGPLTKRDIWEVNPFGNSLVQFEITGEELSTVFSHIVSMKNEPLVVSGITVTVNKSDLKASDLIINGTPVNPTDTFKVVTNSYVFGHFEKFFGIEKGDRWFYDTGFVDRDILVEAAQKAGTISPLEDLRLKIVG